MFARRLVFACLSVVLLASSASAQRWKPYLDADVAVYAKAVEWIEKHDEFFQPAYREQSKAATAAGEERRSEIDTLTGNELPKYWTSPGKSVRGYVSKVDASVQPYALSLPEGFDPKDSKRWPLVVKLHGRANQMNEVNFIARHDGKSPAKGQTWIELEPYGRGNNAFRWAGETDVFEAIADVSRRYRIDRRRITLWGFSMGGAGAWHLGLHHPSKWSSVGAGAGFVDFYRYQNVKEQRPAWEHATLGVYDAVDYALNAANVPVITYGGELDKQLLASTTMVERAKELEVPISLLVGKGMGHKFNDESFTAFMKFHAKHAKTGRPPFPGNREIRFTTRTLKYNQCDWLTIEEVLKQYEPAVVESKVDEAGDIAITTKNVAILQISRDLAELVKIDGDTVPLASAAEGLLPGVYYEHNGERWYPLSYEDSKDFYDNADGRKRHDVQGPIDDAFTNAFVCVRGTGDPWSDTQHDWALWSLKRFESEWSKWMRGTLPVVDDTEITLDAETNYAKNLVLFGDPGSNAVLAKIVDKLPDVTWTEDTLVVGGTEYDPNTHGLSLIFPNPFDKRRYVVINSGHTFRERDFKASNSWLFPRLGDVAVQRITKTAAGFDEQTVWAGLYNGAWRLPPKK